jgi:hypothetical protein
MDISEFEKKLTEAEKQLERVQDAPFNLTEILMAYESLAKAQRELAAAKGEPYAVPYDIGFKQEEINSEPVLLQTNNQTFLTFSTIRQMPDADGKYNSGSYAVVECKSCWQTKFGCPNDEALEGHPLYNKGLNGCGVFKVHNSAWIKKVAEQIWSKFPNTPISNQNHFILTFPDVTFECIADELQATLSSKSYREIFAELTEKIFNQA